MKSAGPCIMWVRDGRQGWYVVPNRVSSIKQSKSSSNTPHLLGYNLKDDENCRFAEVKEPMSRLFSGIVE